MDAVKKTHLFGLIAGLVLFCLFIIYVLIPQPVVDDGYLMSETRKISHDAPFTIHFSQLMNQKSVEEQFSIRPKVAGKINWVDGKTLEYRPTKPLSIGDEYVLSIGSAAKNLYFKELGIDLQLSFVVSGAPYVKFISPMLDADEVELQDEPEFIQEIPLKEDNFIKKEDEKMEKGEFALPPSIEKESNGLLIIQPDQKITVMFDRPMRPLAPIDSLSNYATPKIQIEPPVKGDYRWIGTTAFQFIPEKWTLGTTYTLTLPAGIKSLDGSATEEETVWQLATESLTIVSSEPFFGQDDFSPEGVIRLTFNQPVQLDDIRPGDNVLLYPSNDADAIKNLRKDGFFNTQVSYGQDDKGVTNNSILVFKPEFPYQYNQNYELIVKAGLHPLQPKGYGDRLMTQEFSLPFKTVKKPDVISFTPKNGDQNFEDHAIRINFTSPMNVDLIQDKISIEPSVEKKPSIEVYKTYLEDETIWQAEIRYALQPSQSYTFNFKGPFKDELGNVADKGLTTKFKTAPRSPFLQLLTRNSFGLFPIGLDPFYSLKTVNISRIDLRVCEVSSQEFFRASQNHNWFDYRCPASTAKVIRPKGALNQNHQVDLDLTALYQRDFDKGIYFIELSSPDYIDDQNQPHRFYQTFFISGTNLTLKKSTQDLLVWATDLKTGQPVPRMDIKVMSPSGEVLQTGVTDGEGVYQITKPFNGEVYVVGTKSIQGENRWSMASEFWNQGIQSWQYSGMEGEWILPDEPRIYLYTDRPLYRPQDEIYFKGLYRIDRDADFNFPKESKVRVVLEDSEYNEIDAQEVSLLTDGSFNGLFHLSEKARLGRYHIYAETLSNGYSGQRFYHDFFVEEFKKPTFNVELFPSKISYLKDDKIEVDVRAAYFFGGPIHEGKVTWNLTRDLYIFDEYEADRYFSFSRWLGFHCFWEECRGNSEVIKSGEARLDQNGRLKLSIDPDKEAEESYLYHLDVEVENLDGEVMSQRLSFVVHTHPYYVGLSTDDYLVQSGGQWSADVIAVSPEGNIIEGQRVELHLYREEWNTVKKQGVDGAFYEESVRELSFVQKKTVTTEGEPVAVSFAFTDEMEAGQYVLRSMINDQPASELYFYFSSDDYVNWGASNNNRMELVPDQAEYFVGGKARVLIKSPFGSKDSPVKALVTYERGDIKHYEVIDIKSNSDFIEVPIDKTMAPNIYVSVMVVKGPGKNLDLFINRENKKQLENRHAALLNQISELNAELDRLRQIPSEQLSNRNQILMSKNQQQIQNLKSERRQIEQDLEDLKSLDKNENSLPYELIKPDFRLGLVNLKVSSREHQIFVDLKTDKAHYQIGEPVEVEIRTTDYQNRPVPSVISLAAVDESLLALKANTKVNPLDYFYAPRALQVNTASSLTLQVDRVNIASGDGAKGGGGGGADDPFDKKRGEFKDTAYFNPIIQTDQGGYARITFNPPDNLTTWELWAVASSGQDKFGMKKEDFVVKKEVSLTAILPQFLISEDHLTVGALVHNQSGDEISTKVELIASGLTIEGGSKKTVTVPANESRRVDFVVRVKPVQEDDVLAIEFNSPEDALVQTLPVKTFAYPEVVAINGLVEKSHTEKIQIPQSLVSEMGALHLKAGGNILTSFVSYFKELADYPYGCAEQLISQILPTLMVTYQSKEQDIDLFKWLGLDEEKNHLYIKNVLQDISRFQRFDGGYGFWEGSESSYPMLTIYILYAQYLAEQSGFSISENSMSRAVQYLWSALNDPGISLSLNDRAFALWVLSEKGTYDTGMTLSLYERRSELSLYGQAFMLMNLNRLVENGQQSVRNLASRLKAEMVSHQIVQDRTIHFEEEERIFFDLNTNRRTTAIILMALNRDNPDNPILPNIVNFLARSESKGHLINTQETAWLLLAMLEYARDHDVLNADFSFKAELNHSSVLSGEINEESLNQVFEKLITLDQLKTAPDLNQLDFEKDGKGQMVFDMELKYYLPNETILPQEKGFHITRQYYSFEGSRKDLPAESFTSGQLYKGELNIIVPEDRYQVVVEELLPAGFEAINFNLDTAPRYLEGQINTSDYWYDNPLWYFNHKEIRHDRLLLFADYLPKGVYTYEFLVRAGLPGQYHHLPASARQMYFPEVFGRTEGKLIEIK